jgi:hypothetical protein
MKHSVPHSLGKERAQKVTRAAFEAYAAKYTDYAARANWVQDDRAEISFAVKGMSLKGEVEVTERAIVYDIEVPFFLKPFQKMAMSRIEEEIGKWIDKAKRGEVT